MQDHEKSLDAPPAAMRNWPLILAFILVELYIAYWVWRTTGTLTGKLTPNKVSLT